MRCNCDQHGVKNDQSLGRFMIANGSRRQLLLNIITFAGAVRDLQSCRYVNEAAI